MKISRNPDYSSGKPPVKPIAVVYAILVGLSALLFFWDLDDRLFWGDEAETALLAKNVLRFGFPKTFDGQNRITLYGPAVDGNAHDAWVLSPWLQEYVAAASFRLFGTTTWAGRAPFALAGWASVILFGFVAFKIYRNHKVVLTGCLLLVTSEIFLLHARQCRYYPVAVLGEILLSYGIYRAFEQPENADRSGMNAAIPIAVALTLQFYSNYIIALANVPGVLVIGWTLFRRKPALARPVLIGLAVTAGAALPWALYAKIWQQSIGVGQQNPLEKGLIYLREFNYHFLPLSFLLLPAIGVVREYRQRAMMVSGPDTAQVEPVQDTGEPRTPSDARYPPLSAEKLFERHALVLMPLYLAVIVLAPDVYSRYLLPILPLALLIGAAWLVRFVPSRTILVLLLIIQCCTNGIATMTLYPWRGQHRFQPTFPRFVLGLTAPFDGRLEDVVIFFKQNAKAGQTALGFGPEFPLQFYIGLKIIDMRLTGGSLKEPWPDWILAEHAPGRLGKPMPLPEALAPLYETITFPVHASLRLSDLPEPDVHEYRTPSQIVPCVVYRRKMD